MSVLQCLIRIFSFENIEVNFAIYLNAFLKIVASCYINITSSWFFFSCIEKLNAAVLHRADYVREYCGIIIVSAITQEDIVTKLYNIYISRLRCNINPFCIRL